MIKEFESYSLLPHNTFGLDVKAERYIDFSSREELLSLLGKLKGKRVLVIGGGSNLLFAGDFGGVVLHSSIGGIEVINEDNESVHLRVGSGVNWDKFVEYTVSRGWQGLENLSLIPGEVGASAVQNVGAYGVEAGELIEKVETVSLIDGSLRNFYHDDCRFSYRNSVFKEAERGKYVITNVVFRLNKRGVFNLGYGNLKERVVALGGATLENVRRAVCEIRRAKLPDPAEIGSAGSFFMNPVVDEDVATTLLKAYPYMPHYDFDGRVKLSAGWLIEQCDWKSTPYPTVGVYEHQALVVINRGGATASDILEFATAVRQSVKERFGVELKMEVNIIE